MPSLLPAPPARALVLALSLVLLLAAAPAQALPHEFNATYVATARGFTVGRAQLELVREADGGYQYSSRMRASGPARLFFAGRITEQSRGQFDGDTPIAEAYDYRRTGRGAREDSIRFGNGDGGAAVLTHKDRVQEQQLPVDAVDPLSLHLALMRDVARGEQRMRYLLVEPRRVKAYELEVRGEERVRTEQGEFRAIRVELVGDQGVDDPSSFDLAEAELAPVEEGDATIFWFAPELDYLLVRLQHVDADDGTAVLSLEEKSIVAAADG